MTEYPVMLFDGLCNFCDGSVMFVAKRSAGRPLRFCAMQTNVGQAWLQALAMPLDRHATFVLLESGRAWSRSEAALRVARYMDPPWPSIAAALRVIPRAWRDWLYDRVAANRFALAGRRTSCSLPDTALRARFDVAAPRRAANAAAH